MCRCQFISVPDSIMPSLTQFPEKVLCSSYGGSYARCCGKYKIVILASFSRTFFEYLSDLFFFTRNSCLIPFPSLEFIDIYDRCLAMSGCIEE
jgi:hypothetical protein